MSAKSIVWQLSNIFSWPLLRLIVFFSICMFEILALAQEQVRLPPTKDILDRTQFHQTILRRLKAGLGSRWTDTRKQKKPKVHKAP